MRLLRGYRESSADRTEFVAAIGGFDGIHLGHRALIDRTRELARAQARSSMVVTFEPLPKEYFAPDFPPGRLTNFRERWRLLEQAGPDVLWLLRFTDRLRALRAADFAGLLMHGGVRQIVIGHDFRAGYRGEATAEWFKSVGQGMGLATEVMAPVEDNGLRIGSGAIRTALAAPNFDIAARMLGRPYTMRGRVIAGDRLGRKFGFPTANIRLARRQTPIDGIFAVRVRGVGDGVASIGTRPTVGGTAPLLEVHLFDFTGDLYGRELEVEFVARLRDTLQFNDTNAMIEQMHIDAADARTVLAGKKLRGTWAIVTTRRR
jgi:riboflavin kinase/FMN adenylyltransferase